MVLPGGQLVWVCRIFQVAEQSAVRRSLTGCAFQRHLERRYHDFTFEARHAGLEQLIARARQRYMTADHGYLFGDELDTDMKIESPGGQTRRSSSPRLGGQCRHCPPSISARVTHGASWMSRRTSWSASIPSFTVIP